MTKIKTTLPYDVDSPLVGLIPVGKSIEVTAEQARVLLQNGAYALAAKPAPRKKAAPAAAKPITQED